MIISAVCLLTEDFLTGEVGDPVLVTTLLVQEQGPDPDLVPVLLLLVVAGLLILNYSLIIVYYYFYRFMYKSEVQQREKHEISVL